MEMVVVLLRCGGGWSGGGAVDSGELVGGGPREVKVDKEGGSNKEGSGC